ncbi:MAG: methyltransferase domain-containing protein [Cyanobacteria bacterium]|nr:methyltransferase domain-containing protein [Cyanobacteria bacterium CG_2015-16_32_12]NCO78867.1 methyltransferase domain-containing protein [Cyanobacteria bacterium CG_2015-22_32_23]NCQ05108.1 methyltransferase domain-containing protein [Cyanobacteria bacterium CG_2015-09_32_10]NCQ41099.1 methyltransferase domain-containing protein [Cyanobacteria bacterium CG_2015-04_32_10]NCS85789.1 methyltransferase domain-containing protein [Cyanobacteria bacterium CG_2015-02_32_10]
MSNKTLNLSPELYEYLLSISLRESPVLHELRQEAVNHPLGKMQISADQAQFLALLIKLMGVKKILEIGVFMGYSSTAMALALPEEGKLIACDINEDFTAIAKSYWQKAQVDHKITLHLAPALETLDKLILHDEKETFDFIFIDADKSNYDNYYEKSLQLLRKGGLIAIDNVLWYGKVADVNINDHRTQKIRDFNTKLAQDSRIDLSLIPIGDGLTLAMKK